MEVYYYASHPCVVYCVFVVKKKKHEIKLKEAQESLSSFQNQLEATQQELKSVSEVQSSGNSQLENDFQYQKQVWDVYQKFPSLPSLFDC